MNRLAELFEKRKTTAGFWAADARAEFAAVLEAAMESAGVTRSELADRLGVSKPRVTRMLRADANLRIDTMARIAFALEKRVCVTIVPFATTALSIPHTIGKEVQTAANISFSASGTDSKHGTERTTLTLIAA